jgi:hypothetical protein
MSIFVVDESTVQRAGLERPGPGRATRLRMHWRGGNGLRDRVRALFDALGSLLRSAGPISAAPPLRLRTQIEPKAQTRRRRDAGGAR